MTTDKFKKLLIRTLAGITYIHVSALCIVVILGSVGLQKLLEVSL
jgi:hypothetical protein